MGRPPPPGPGRRSVRPPADRWACQRGRDHDARALRGWRNARPGRVHCDHCRRACLLLPRPDWQCRYRHRDVEAGKLASRKSSCEAVTSLKGLKAEGDGMPIVATYVSAGMDTPVIGASRDGIGAAFAHAYQDAGANDVITGVEIVPAGEDRPVRTCSAGRTARGRCRNSGGAHGVDGRAGRLRRRHRARGDG